MAAKRLNVLVYTGTGTTGESVRQCMLSLRRLLSPNYAVIPVSESVILKEPWSVTCALLVIPGGGDLGYCRVLNGAGNRRIAEFVRRGGSYLGLCAGGYYGSKRCEFETGDKVLEVIGSRELAFFPGTCRGGAFKGFQYHSESGARAVALELAQGRFKDKLPAQVINYYNGGGVYVDAKSLEAEKVEVLAEYADQLDVDGGDGNAATVLCQIGEGKVILSGTHPEFAAENLYKQPEVPGYDELIAKLAADDRTRVGFLSQLLEILGLEVNKEGYSELPRLSPMHLSAIDPSMVTEMLCNWEEVIEKVDGEEIISEVDKFRLRNKDSAWTVDDLASKMKDLNTDQLVGVQDYTTITKDIIAHESGIPDPSLTPKFNHELYFMSLKRFRTVESGAESWGDELLYGDVVTSTNSLLEKNHKFLSQLHTGFTFTASSQVAARGRGTNVWIAPPGALLFSTVINHPAHLAASRPVVFIQYIAAIAVVEAIHSYGSGYKDLPVKLKWPNDIYAKDPNSPDTYVKIGGLLSQCAYSDGSYQIVLGIGINANNPRPTTSISDLLPSTADKLHLESLLARMVTRIESIYAQFRKEGFSSDLETRYYRHWLHTGQFISLEAEAGARGRVIGITKDWGMLRVEETDSSGRGTGKIWALQSDENSFDYWKGLVRRKE